MGLAGHVCMAGLPDWAYHLRVRVILTPTVPLQLPLWTGSAPPFTTPGARIRLPTWYSLGYISIGSLKRAWVCTEM
jgi:hypothetical protein